MRLANFERGSSMTTSFGAIALQTLSLFAQLTASVTTAKNSTKPVAGGGGGGSGVGNDTGIDWNRLEYPPKGRVDGWQKISSESTWWLLCKGVNVSFAIINFGGYQKGDTHIATCNYWTTGPEKPYEGAKLVDQGSITFNVSQTDGTRHGDMVVKMGVWIDKGTDFYVPTDKDMYSCPSESKYRIGASGPWKACTTAPYNGPQ